jgi:7,8-dihydropterin-6-yl-methyl-4-(beta-D-ribofuranosyl)aminobenzene 5'-phosphate synthase
MAIAREGNRLFGLVAAMATSLIAVLAGCQAAERPPDRPSSRPSEQIETPGRGETVITIVYDNNAGRGDLTPAWGFACVVQGMEKTILFDTGGDGRILLANMRKVGLDPNQVDAVVISHIHGDHTGGLASLLRLRGGVPVYTPTGFPASFKEHVRSQGGQHVEADESVQLCAGAKTTGTLGKGAIEEHGLCVKTPSGWVLITGCAHPGVGNMAAKAKDLTGGPIALVVGGFHMGGYSQEQITGVVDRFEQLGVRCVAPCHCSGGTAREVFKKRYGERCTLAGVGAVFRFAPSP